MPQTVNLQFPTGGLSEHEPFQRPDANRTPDSLNVMPFDQIDDRARGGSRPGSSLYFEDQVNGSNRIQCLAAGAIAAGDTDVVPVGDPLVDVDFTTATSSGELRVLYPSIFTVDGRENGTFSSYYPFATLSTGVTTGLKTFNISSPPNDAIGWCAIGEGRSFTATQGTLVDPSISLGSSYILECSGSLRTTGSNAVSRRGVGFAFRLNTSALTSASGYGVSVFKIIGDNTQFKVRVFDYSDSTTTNLVAESSAFSISYRTTGAIDWTEPFTMKLVVNGSEMEVFIDGSSKLSTTLSSFGSQTGIALIGDTENDEDDSFWAYFSFKASAAAPSSSARKFRIAAASGGNAYISDPGETSMTLATNGSSVFGSGIPVRWTSAFSYFYFVDGSYTGYRRLKISDGTMTSWTADITGSGAGTLPTDGGSAEGGTIICTYRGRVVIAGLNSDPQNWFMSRLGDPLDWDYGGTIDGQEPVAGDQGTAVGKAGDIITAMAPWSDDLLIFGGDHTLSMMSGDPAAGGRIDTISNQVGIVGPDSWAHDPLGNLHFLSYDGHYRMPSGGGQPECLSRGRLDKTFRDTDYATNRPILVWDREKIGLWIFFARTDDETPEPIFWDQRTDGYWRQQFPQGHGPFSALLFDADRPDDRAILLGGQDGYIYFLDSTTNTDNGTAIASHVVFPPTMVGDQARVNVLQTGLIVDDTFGTGMSLKAFDGRYAAQAVDKAVANSAGTQRWERSINLGGRQINFMNRVSGHAVCYRLAATGGSWAMESAMPAIDPAGLARRTR